MTTVNYSWTLPTVGASTNTWGTLLNTILTDIDLKMVTATHIVAERSASRALTNLTGITVVSGGASITGNSSVTGTLSASDTVSIVNNSATTRKLSFYSTGNGLSENANIRVNNDGATTNSGVMYFATRIAGGALTDNMTLDSSGNLGIGVTPSAWRSGDKVLDMGATTSLVNAQGVNTRLYNNAYVTAGGISTYKTTDFASYYDQGSGVHRWLVAPSGTAGNAITFTQAMTLDDSGHLLVRATTTAPSTGGFAVVNGAAMFTQTDHASGSASGEQYARFSYAGTQIGSITQNGTTAVAYNTTSDPRLKTNVRPANAARFMDIEFVDFEWIDGKHDCGVLAPQLQSVYPDLVLGEVDATEMRTVEITPAVPAVLDEEGNEVTPAIPAVTEEQEFPVYQQVNYTGLIGRMGTRVQQLQRTVDALEARLAALESA